METNEELKMAWEFVEHTGTSLFLTGRAGTGKTTFLRELRAKSPKRMVVTAPTGIAAINAGGVTLHSFFQLPLAPFVPGANFASGQQRRYQLSPTKRQIIASMDLLVIDEVSMVRADLLDAVDDTLRRYRDRSKPFGGVQLLLIGDLQQLAPVVTPADEAIIGEYYKTPYFFSSNALKAIDYQMIELQKIYRQTDDDFIALLGHIRAGDATDDTLARLNSRYIPGFRPPEGQHYVRLVTHNRQADDINGQCLRQLPTKSFVLKAVVKGKFPDSSYPLDMYMELREGAQVMLVKNAKDRSYYNGLLAEVVGYDGRTVRVRSHDDGSLLDVGQEVWQNCRYNLDSTTKEIKEEVEGTFTQYPLRLAYAITIHKSQGLTFERLIIDASRAFSHGQTYVALSRCKTLEGIVLSTPLSRSAIIADAVVDSYTATQEARRPTPEKVRSLAAQYTTTLLGELFGMERLRACTAAVHRVLAENFYKLEDVLIADYHANIGRLEAMQDVARRFREQYVAMLGQGADIGASALQERIHKGAAYFLAQLQPLMQLAENTAVKTGNKLVAQRLDDRLADLGAELAMRTELLTAYANAANAFSTADYLRRKARIALGADDNPGAKGARPAAGQQKAGTVKIVKQTTFDTTLDFLAKGFTPADIAGRRGLALSTIYSHFLRLITEGKLRSERVIDPERRKAVEQWLEARGKEFSYTAAKEHFEGKMPMEEVVLAARLKSAEDKAKQKDQPD